MQIKSPLINADENKTIINNTTLHLYRVLKKDEEPEMTTIKDPTTKSILKELLLKNAPRSVTSFVPDASEDQLAAKAQIVLQQFDENARKLNAALISLQTAGLNLNVPGNSGLFKAAAKPMVGEQNKPTTEDDDENKFRPGKKI